MILPLGSDTDDGEGEDGCGYDDGCGDDDDDSDDDDDADDDDGDEAVQNHGDTAETDGDSDDDDAVRFNHAVCLLAQTNLKHDSMITIPGDPPTRMSKNVAVIKLRDAFKGRFWTNFEVSSGPHHTVGF